MSYNNHSLMSNADSKSPLSMMSINQSSYAQPKRTLDVSRLLAIISASSSSCYSISGSAVSSSSSESLNSGGISPLVAIFMKSAAVKSFGAFGFEILIFSLLIIFETGFGSGFSRDSNLEGGLSIFSKLFHL